MRSLTKAKFSIVFASCQFWMPTFILFLNDRGITTVQIYQLLAFYSLCMVLFEYPTGVIGDYFSHKVSVSIGYLILSAVFMAMVFPSSFVWYGVLLIFGALGAALISGSDTALLHTLSENFKDDYAQVKLYSIVMSVFAITFGAFAASFDLRYPFYLSSIFFLIASFFSLSMDQYRYERISGNIFVTARTGMKLVLGNLKLLLLIGVSSLLGAFFFSFKWFYNPFFLQLSIPVEQWGVIIGVATIFIALGAQIYRKVSHLPIISMVALLLILVATLAYSSRVILSLGALFVIYVLRGYIETVMSVDINNAIRSSVRASVLSFQSLALRIFSVGIIFVSGLILERYSFAMLMYLLAAFLFAVLLYPLMRLKTLNS